MAKRSTTRFVATNLRQHAAVKAWSALGPKRVVPDGIEILKEKTDITAYFQVVRDHWPHVDFETIRQLASYGTVLRCVAIMSWEAPFLGMDWAAMPMAKIRSYHAILPHAMQVAGWAV